MVAEKPKAAEKLPPARSMGSQPHTGIANPEEQRWEEDPILHMVVKISSDSDCLGDPDVLSQDMHYYCYSTRLGIALLGPQLLVRLLCHTWILWKGLQAAPSSDFWGPIFLGEALGRDSDSD